MKRFVWLDVCSVVLVIAALGCGARERTTTTTKSDSTSSQRIDDERARYQGAAERQLAAIGARIDSLKLALDQGRVQAKAEMREEIADLEARRSEAARKLEDLKVAGAERWSVARRRMVDVLDDLDRRFDSLRDRLRDDRG